MTTTETETETETETGDPTEAGFTRRVALRAAAAGATALAFTGMVDAGGGTADDTADPLAGVFMDGGETAAAIRSDLSEILTSQRVLFSDLDRGGWPVTDAGTELMRACVSLAVEPYTQPANEAPTHVEQTLTDVETDVVLDSDKRVYYATIDATHAPSGEELHVAFTTSV